MTHLLGHEKSYATKFKDSCRNSGPEDPVQTANFAFFDRCARVVKLPFSKANEVAFSECLQSYVAMQIFTTAEKYADTPAKNFSDPELLRTVLAGTPMIGGANPIGRYGELADRLVELQPTNPSANAIALQAAYIGIAAVDDIDHAPVSPSDPRMEKVSKFLEQLEKLTPDDPRVLEAKMLISRATGDHTALIRTAEEAKSKGKEVGYFFSAMASYTDGKSDDAKRELLEAAKKFPESMRVRMALDQITRIPAGMKSPVTSIFVDSLQILNFDNETPKN